MRDIFEEIFENQPLDPTESARRNMRPKLGRGSIRTRHGRRGGLRASRCCSTAGRCARRRGGSLAAPARELAEALAAEWDAQQDKVDPAAMPLTRLANSIIDGVAPAPEPVAAEIEKYLGTDLLFYRAAGPDGSGREPAAHWDPIVDWARRKARRALRAGRGRDARGAAGGGDRCGRQGDPERRRISTTPGGSARSTSSPR